MITRSHNQTDLCRVIMRVADDRFPHRGGYIEFIYIKFFWRMRHAGIIVASRRRPFFSIIRIIVTYLLSFSLSGNIIKENCEENCG